MKGNILIHKLLIQRAGEHRYFQVDIPADVLHITGIQTGVQLIDIVPVMGTGQVGSLQLQTTGSINECYNSNVKADPVDALKSDLGLTVYQAGFVQENRLMTNGIAQRSKAGTELIHLPSCACLYGNYRDLIGKALQRDVQYRVNITFLTVKQQP